MTATPGLTPGKPATIHDVAALSGVAASTVSRALSNPDRVNFRTRARIEAAAAQLNYVPNAQAKALSSGQSKAVAVLVADITNPFFFDIIRGTQLQLKAAGYTQLLVDTEESDEVESSTIEQLRNTADGIILTASRLSDESLTQMAAKLPTVAINRSVPGVGSVILDTPTATNQALDHLISLGHTHIAYLAGPESSRSNHRRWAALSAADALVHSGATAGIAFNDLIAIGMLQRLRERGVRVPEDMSIVGCDDIFGADFCSPPLTTVTAPVEQAGRVAVTMLLGKINSAVGAPPRNQSILPTHLTIRSSTGPAPLPARKP